MRSSIRFFILIFVISLTSCIKPDNSITGAVYYYRVINNSDSRIKVRFYGFAGHTQYTNISDSTVYFDAGEQRNLLVTYNANYNLLEPENKDTLQGIRVINIFKNDTFPAQRNYRLRKYWNYSHPNGYKYEFDLVITNDGFKP